VSRMSGLDVGSAEDGGTHQDELSGSANTCAGECSKWNQAQIILLSVLRVLLFPGRLAETEAGGKEL
jgi:hypothetical protein